MSGPVNAVVGNDSYGVEIPETTVDQDALTEEKKAAKYSKTKEFQELKRYMESRIDHYQKYLPDGREISSLDRAQLGDKWEVANIIVREFGMVIGTYERAAEAVKESENVGQ